MAAELAGDGIKLLVVASLQASEDALEPIAAAAGVPTLALDATLVHAAARAGEGRIAAIWADGTLRAQPWIKAHRFQRGGVEVVPLPWAGLAAAVEAGRAPDPATRARGAGRLHRRAHLPLRGDGRRARSTSRSTAPR